MRIPLGNRQSQEPVGLDLDGAFMAAVQASGGRLERAVSAELPEGAMSEGEVRDPAALTSAIKEFFRVNGLPKAVRLGVANQQIVLRRLDLPRIENPDELLAAVRFQAQAELPMPMEDAVLDFQVIGHAVSPEGNARLHVMVVAARLSMISQLVDAVRAAGLKPAGIDLDAFAVVRTLTEPSVSDDAARVHVHLGTVTNIAIAVGATCVFTRVLPGEVGDASLLAGEIRPSVDFYMSQPEARPVAEVILSGPGSAAAELADELASELVLPVRIAAPLGSLAGTPLLPGDDPHRYTVAAGLALGERS